MSSSAEIDDMAALDVTVSPQNADSGRGPPMDDLAPRVASSIVLIALGVSVALKGGAWIAGATGGAAVIMSYEWARMSEPRSVQHAFVFCVAATLGAVMAASWGLWREAFVWMVLCGVASGCRRKSIVGFIESAGGVIYIGAPCVLFLFLRDIQPGGLQIVMSLFSIIWAADAAAYFGGKLIGGPKLVPHLSPAKTWAGLATGATAGIGAAVVVAKLIGGPVIAWCVVGFALAVIGLLGDLFESLLKRRFGVKDASRVIPGHGGVLDRLDGLMAATVATALLVSTFPDIAPRLLGLHR